MRRVLPGRRGTGGGDGKEAAPEPVHEETAGPVGIESSGAPSSAEATSRPRAAMEPCLHARMFLDFDDEVVVTLDAPANVMLLDDSSFRDYSEGRSFDYVGGRA